MNDLAWTAVVTAGLFVAAGCFRGAAWLLDRLLRQPVLEPEGQDIERTIKQAVTLNTVAQVIASAGIGLLGLLIFIYAAEGNLSRWLH